MGEVPKLPGGGGHGDPAERDAADIDRDLKAGYITEEGAKREGDTAAKT